MPGLMGEKYVYVCTAKKNEVMWGAIMRSRKLSTFVSQQSLTVLIKDYPLWKICSMYDVWYAYDNMITSLCVLHLCIHMCYFSHVCFLQRGKKWRTISNRGRLHTAGHSSNATASTDKLCKEKLVCMKPLFPPVWSNIYSNVNRESALNQH